jgi:HMG-box domain
MNNHDEQDRALLDTFAVDTINEMNDSFEGGDVDGVPVNFESPRAQQAGTAARARSSNNGSSSSLNQGPTLKTKKKKATAVKKQKSFSKHDENIKDRPKKALSAYNLFFASERKKLLQETPVRPTGKPRGSHGKVGFSEMAKIIGTKWKDLDPQDKLYYEGQAAKDKWRYNVEMGEWTKNRLEQKAQAAVAAAAAAQEAATVRPAAQGMTEGHEWMNDVFASTDPKPAQQQQEEHCNFDGSTTTTVSAFDDTPVVLPLVMSSSFTTTTTVNMPTHADVGNDASEADARDYLRRLQQASYSTLAAPTAVVDAADNTNFSLKSEQQLVDAAMQQSYDAKSSTARTIYNLSSSRSSNSQNYNHHHHQNNLNINTSFDPIPLAVTCRPASISEQWHRTTAPYDSIHHLVKNMDDDCVDLVVDLFSPYPQVQHQKAASSWDNNNNFMHRQ